MVIDSHCHLDPEAYGSPDAVDAVVERARVAGVRAMVAIGSGYGLESAGHARAVAERHLDVWYTAGLHPHHASAWSPAVADLIRAHAAHPRCLAIGEIGLDFHYDLSPRDAQRTALREQVHLALELGLPVVIHDRESDDETLDTLEAEGAFAGGVLFHCFSGTVAAMERIVGLGGLVSIPGIVTFKRADEMRDVARRAPLDRLLVETDAPFLSPVPLRGKRNEPARVTLVAAKVAELRGMDVEALGAVTAENTARFFGFALP